MDSQFLSIFLLYILSIYSNSDFYFFLATSNRENAKNYFPGNEKPKVGGRRNNFDFKVAIFS